MKQNTETIQVGGSHVMFADTPIHKSDAEKIRTKFRELGGILHAEEDCAMASETMNCECWGLNGNGIILLIYENGDYGLYRFVGDNGDPLEKDIALLEAIAKGE